MVEGSGSKLTLAESLYIYKTHAGFESNCERTKYSEIIFLRILLLIKKVFQHPYEKRLSYLSLLLLLLYSSVQKTLDYK